MTFRSRSNRLITAARAFSFSVCLDSIEGLSGDELFKSLV